MRRGSRLITRDAFSCQNAGRAFRPLDWPSWLVYTLALALVCALAAAGSGCSSPGKAPAALAAPRFSEQEVRSKTWTDPQGQRLQLLDWTPVHFREDELVIAKYGSAGLHRVTCLEFYKINRLPGGRAAKALEPSLNPRPPLTSGYTDLPERVSFELLSHDYSPEMVASVSTEERNGALVITILRESSPEAGEQRQAFRYMLTYSSGRGIRWNPALEQWAIADRAGPAPVQKYVE